MTNREKFLKKLSEMTNEQLARVFCKVSWCSDCPARAGCFDLSGIKEVLIDWLEKGEQKTEDEIEVGDVVRLCRHKVPYIVTSCDGDDDTYILMTVNGGFIKAEKYNVRKIGRHFDIDKILKDMRHD